MSLGPLDIRLDMDHHLHRATACAMYRALDVGRNLMPFDDRKLGIDEHVEFYERLPPDAARSEMVQTSRAGDSFDR